ncbi:MAG TPA: response regulator [Polyangiaceae bacterium]|nr:response regulator [Polyangiaceae bacterium]
MPADRKRVLIVDDDEDLRDVMQDVIMGLGHEALQASNAEDAVELASRGGIDVALIDLGLPRVDGFEVARRLRATQQAASTRLVALTGYSDAQSRKTAEEAGFDDYLVKPVGPDAIVALVSQTPA